ncbi:2-phosphosulfolactate phosphatase [Metabacillus idriensis]|uniref:Probable 2-phosphosulfolactate phosphatase n=1 Tax=Metabacillus idriensis TaxID=324768 RepID=A0A6I2M6E3_9BACI|nr:2-phosphosulfolactate phosphatase [Metabacillus idriensis]MCM3594899.1 2-phosphosulfolactate phosphatase [Metabacillus idriensis]MRX53077.1 hypothetical protein [Metabacillus idriensis]OHR67155.1 hypothetical protein HMPREF3291_11295 [Bacillus sp. HMSC76G11]
MRKINVITQKELVDSELIRNCTAVVIDVFLATSTITFLLEKGCELVYAVKDAEAALDIVNQHKNQYLLIGEWNGKAIENFEYPDPTLIVESKQRTAIICTTNGTIAIENAKHAKTLFVSSLINGHRISDQIIQLDDGSSIILVCSGNAGRFSLEDFIGAGQIIDHLVKKDEFDLSDAARLAREAFLHAKSQQFVNLLESETAELLRKTGFGHTIQWIIDQVEKVNVVPIYLNGKITRKQNGGN